MTQQEREAREQTIQASPALQAAREAMFQAVRTCGMVVTRSKVTVDGHAYTEIDAVKAHGPSRKSAAPSQHHGEDTWRLWRAFLRDLDAAL